MLTNFLAFCYGVVAVNDREKKQKKINEKLHLNARDPLESAQLLKLQLWLHEVDHTFVQCDPRKEIVKSRSCDCFPQSVLHVVLLDVLLGNDQNLVSSST